MAKNQPLFFVIWKIRILLKKTVRKLELNTGSQITNQKDILGEMGNFYNLLFQKRDQYTQNYQLNNFLITLRRKEFVTLN